MKRHRPELSPSFPCQDPMMAYQLVASSDICKAWPPDLLACTRRVLSVPDVLSRRFIIIETAVIHNPPEL